VDRETRSSILPVRTRYRFSSVAERGPPKPDVDCSIQSAGANVYCFGWLRAPVELKGGRERLAPRVQRLRPSQINHDVAIGLRAADQHIAVSRCIDRVRPVADPSGHKCGLTGVADSRSA
jgi:hypothetical protein